jgi:hypothetical protein
MGKNRRYEIRNPVKRVVEKVEAPAVVPEIKPGEIKAPILPEKVEIKLRPATPGRLRVGV